MSKIKQARAWLARKERTNDSEKRGDITLQQIIWTAVAVILIGLVVGILVVILNRQGDQAADSAAELTANIEGEPAIYNVTCNVNRAVRAATIARVSTADNTNNRIRVPWSTAGGYGLPAGNLNGSDTRRAATDEGLLRIAREAGATGNANVGFFAAASRITEARFNADFDGDGEITSDEVIGILQQGESYSEAASEFEETAGAGEFMLADPTDDIANNLAVGNRLVVNRSEDCWRIA